ncbi:EpsG family protein [Aeromonas caviae]|uniref:EpsG family protein n=1 Tax=Aeromonas caviae TaxID=648 RepID=UPI00191CAE42|nr:EpsG family protein [Aeromonas caviae]MBL0550667.1 EpsG family protein [Aeromonas caviae]
MELYLYVFLLGVFIYFLGNLSKGNKVINLYLYFSFSFVILFFAALRKAGVGADDLVYVERFIDIPKISEWIVGEYSYSYSDVWMEPGYTIFSAVIREFSDSYTLLFFCVAVLSTGLTLYFYREYSQYPIVCALIFFSHTFLYKDINQIRAAVASAMALWIIPCFFRRRYFKCLLILFIAATFHIAVMIVILPMLFFIIFNESKHRRFLAIILLLSMFMGMIGISKVFLNIMPSVGVFSDKIVSYSTSEEAETTSLFDLTNIKNIFISCFIFSFWNRFKGHERLFLVFFLLATSWRIMFSDFGILAGRVATFLSITEPLILASLITFFRPRIIVGVIIIFYAFITLYMNLYFKSGRYPYEFFFQ